jgi:hypothetical protein
VRLQAYVVTSHPERVQADLSALSVDFGSASLSDARPARDHDASFASSSSVDELADASVDIAPVPLQASTPATSRPAPRKLPSGATSESLNSDDDGSSSSSLSSVSSGDEHDEDELDEDALESGSDDSREPDDAYSDVDADSVADASLGDASFAPSVGSLDDDDYEEAASDSASDSDEEEEEEGRDGADDASVDLEWEEAQELAGAAVSAHTRALCAAGVEGMSVQRRKTIKAVVEVVRALVNTVGAFDVGPYSRSRHLLMQRRAGRPRECAYAPRPSRRARGYPAHACDGRVCVRGAGRARGAK